MKAALPIVLGVLATVTDPRAQSVLELGGEVIDVEGRPIARARVEVGWFDDLEPRTPGERRGRYGAAARAACAALRPLRTVTGDDGSWRLFVPPQIAPWLTVQLVPARLSITADGHEPWLRVARDPRALPAVARLPRAKAGDRLVVRLEGAREPWRGLATIARSFRVSPTRTVWLRDRSPLPSDGVVRSTLPPVIAGEPSPAQTTARVEGYRVTIWAEDRDVVQIDLSPGEHSLEVPPAPWRPRPVLGERAQPAATPLTARWRIDGREFELELDSPRVPMLGGEPPVAVSSPDGPVEIDAWDPDEPLFVAPGTDVPVPDDEPGTMPHPRTRVLVRALDEAGSSVSGVAVLAEDLAANDAAATASLFGTTDARGEVTLHGLPPGEWRFLLHHPTIGEREAVIAAREVDPNDEPEAETVTLLTAFATTPVPAEGAVGTVRIGFDGDTSTDGWTEVGTLTPDGRVVRRRFPGHPDTVLLEGLVPGPVTVFASRDDRPPALWASQMAGAGSAAPLNFATVEPRRFVIDVRDHRGDPVRGTPAVSLVERPADGRTPESAALFDPRPTDEPGRFTLDARVVGPLWLRVHTDSGAVTEVALPALGDGVVEVVMPLPPEPPADSADAPR